jgi:IclR family acetate operon transcriptional repressor
MLLAALVPTGRVSEFLPAEPLAAFTPNTLTARAALEAELALIRRQGHSVDREERDLGVTCVAVMIPNDEGLHAAVSLAGPTGELGENDRARLLPILRSTAGTLGADATFLSALRRVRGADLTEHK